MPTDKQIEANRLNAQKSTGPRTAAGKARSSANALKSGLHAKTVIIPGERECDFADLQKDYYARFQPATLEQRQYVDLMLHADWRLRRLAVAEAQLWDYVMSQYDVNEDLLLGEAFDRSDSFLRLQRCIDSTERSYRRALHELQRLQAQAPPPPPPPALQLVRSPRPVSKIGFVPSKSSAAPPAAAPQPSLLAPGLLPEPVPSPPLRDVA